MKWISIDESPLEIYGLALAASGRYWRLPEDVIDTVSPEVSNLARQTAGARVRFRTDSATLQIEYTPTGDGLGGLTVGKAGKNMIAVYIDGRFEGTRISNHSVLPTFSFDPRTGAKKAQMQEILIYLPVMDGITSLRVGLDDDAQILAPEPYTFTKQVVFYGSSITQGFSACHPGRSYVDQVCRALDTDYLNLGFSGAAKAEDAIRDYIAGLPMSVFVFDYDHNAPSVEFLRDTHEQFFLAVRERQPDLPILLMSRPDFYTWLPTDYERRDIVRATYENALARGDKNVRFLDGESFFGYEEDRYECTVDGVHPNDLGFTRMAAVVRPALEEMLKA